MLQATPVPASPAFSRSHRFGGTLEIRRYAAMGKVVADA
jgi:hypothetical protein